jgi:hypothetical protein
MRRATVYPGAVPLETDILNTNKNVMIAIGHVLQDMIGTSTLFSGLGCVPTSPAGMTVNVNPGRAYSLQAADTGAYSSLAADAHTVMKQGILLDAVNFACPAPGTAGFSINYLIQGAFQEVDGGSTVLPYYNASNPATAYSGPNNTGTSNTTYRDNTVQLQLKAGTAATTGSQVTPTPDSGFTGLWVVTVAFGASTIVAGNITQYAGAPFLSSSLLAQIQAPIPGRLLRTSVYTLVTGVQNVSVDGGTPTTTGASTFTALASTSSVEIECQAGGGGGGGVSTNGTLPATAGGAGAGAYGRSKYSSGFSSLAITVGAGGAGGTAGNNFGSAGGSSSAGALISCPGGFSGAGGTPTAAPFFNGGSNQSSAPTGANLYAVRGNAGQYGIVLGNSNVAGGIGGGSVFGGASPSVANTAGAQAINYGAGGGGASALSALNVNQGGGAGANGIVIVREYA